jgi:hypothetical protein
MRRIQLYLSLIGCVLSLAGALLLFVELVPMLATWQQEAQLAPDNAVYVGADTCFTCHEDAQLGWSTPLHVRAIEDVVVNPHAVAMTPPNSADAVPIGSNGETLAVQALDIDLSFPSEYRIASPFSSSLTLPESAEEQQP